MESGGVPVVAAVMRDDGCSWQKPVAYGSWYGCITFRSIEEMGAWVGEQ